MPIKDAYPLLRIDELFSTLLNAYCFVRLDLRRGYQQISIREQGIPQTAFITHNGLYVVNVMPFWLWNAPATFHRLMDGIFRHQIGKDVEAYLEHLLMYPVRHGEMLPILERTLGHLLDAGLQCKPRKWQVFSDSIHYLGQIIKDGKIAADRS